MVDPIIYEQWVIERIKAAGETLPVTAFPDDVVTFVREGLKGGPGHILVSIAGGRKGESTEERGKFIIAPSVTILHRDLRPGVGHQGSYTYIKRIVELFDGEDGKGTRAMIGGEPYRVRVTDFGFVDKTTNGYWQYAIGIELTPKI